MIKTNHNRKRIDPRGAQQKMDLGVYRNFPNYNIYVIYLSSKSMITIKYFRKKYGINDKDSIYAYVKRKTDRQTDSLFGEKYQMYKIYVEIKLPGGSH